MTDVPPPESPKPPRGRPRRQKGFDDEAVLSDEEVARRVDVRGGAGPRAPIERAAVRAPRTPARRPERTGARDSLLLIGLVIVGLVAVRLFLPDGPLTASATQSPGASQAAVVTTGPSTAATPGPTGGLITLPPTPFVPTATPAELTAPPITPAPTVAAPTPTLKPGQTPVPTPKPTKTPTVTSGPTPPGTSRLYVVVNVINGDGGTAGPGAWMITVSSAGTATPASFSGVSGTGTLVTLSAGVSYSVSSSGPSGYAKSVSANCSSQDGGLPVANQTETCTIVVNDIAPKVTVYTIVDGGGPLAPSDITVSVSGTNVRPSTSFSGTSAGQGVTFFANTPYAITMSAAPTDYDKSSPSSGCDGGGLAIGATATCTITYTYNPPAPTDTPGTGLVLPFVLFLGLPRRRSAAWRSNRAG